MTARTAKPAVTRTCARTATVMLPAAVVSVVAAAPALAAPPVDAGAEPGDPLTMVETLMLFVGAPLGLFVLISLLAVAPSLVRRGRQNALGWLSEPVWFGGPEKPELSETASEHPVAGGGASARW